jgi:hypothetical protein
MLEVFFRLLGEKYVERQPCRPKLVNSRSRHCLNVQIIIAIKVVDGASSAVALRTQ